MQVTEERVDDVLVLDVDGRVDSSNAKDFETFVLTPVQNGSTQVLIDLADLSYISSAGLRVLLMAAKRLRAAGGKIVLCAMPPQIREVFEVSGFTSIFPIADNRPAGLEAF